MNHILSDQKKFTVVNLKDDTLLNFAVNQNKYVDKVLNKLFESKQYDRKIMKLLKPVGSGPGVMYSLCKYIKQAWRIARHLDQFVQL